MALRLYPSLPHRLHLAVCVDAPSSPTWYVTFLGRGRYSTERRWFCRQYWFFRRCELSRAFDQAGPVSFATSICPVTASGAAKCCGCRACCWDVQYKMQRPRCRRDAGLRGLRPTPSARRLACGLAVRWGDRAGAGGLCIGVDVASTAGPCVIEVVRAAACS